MNPYLEVILRSVAVYLFIIMAIRLFGKKELSQLSVIDLVFILLISNSVQNAMVGTNSSLPGGILAAGALFGLNSILKYFQYRNKSFSRFLQGDPVMLVHKGIVLKEVLRKEQISMGELEAAAREHGVETIAEVDLAVLETDGSISILSENFRKHTSRKRKAHKAVAKNN